MKITRVEPIPLRLPFAGPFKISHGEAREMLEVVIVRVHTDEGIVGVGETQAWRRQGSAETLANLVHTIEDHFEPILLGHSPFDIAGALHALNGALYGSLYAQAAIGDALYDLVGQALGVPVHVLLGGECRNRVRIGAVLAIKPTVEELIDSAQAFYERGFRHFGLKIGADPAADVRNVVALRKHLGDRIVLRVDANGALSYDAALGLLKHLAHRPLRVDRARQRPALADHAGAAGCLRPRAVGSAGPEPESSTLTLRRGACPRSRASRHASVTGHVRDLSVGRGSPGAVCRDLGRFRTGKGGRRDLLLSGR